MLADRQYAELFDVSLAFRSSDYSTSGSDTTGKVGFKYMPTENLMFRGTFAEGLRAPSIGELFGTQARFDAQLNDPCNSDASGAIPALLFPSVDEEDFDFEHARTIVPKPLPRPTWQKSDACWECMKPFGPTRLRHHCRFCGKSFCQTHSSFSQRLPHLGYHPDVPERVCDACHTILEEQNLAERVAWRLARCRDYDANQLTPYFETGFDSVEDVAIRVTRAAIDLAKKLPLGAQATVAVETVDVLRKYGLHGIYGIMLRQEFLAAADLLRRAHV